LNLATALSDTKQILRTGGQADILILGDSLSFRPGSYLPFFRDMLQSRYGNGGAGYQGFSLWTGAGFNSGWLTQGINADLPPHRGLDGLWNRWDGVSGIPNSAYFYSTHPQVELQYVTEPGGGSFLVRRGIEGPVVTTINTNSVHPGLGVFSHSIAPGEGALTVQPVAGSGSFTILGQNNLSGSTGPAVRVHRGANGGWGVDNFLRRDFTFDSQIEHLDIDLYMIWIGQNDQANSRPGYAAKLNTLVDRVQAASPTAEVVLVGTYDSGSPAIAPLVEAMADVAAARGLGFINLFGTAGSYQAFLNNGWLDDGVHFSPAGGGHIARLLYDAFVTDGASLERSNRKLRQVMESGAFLPPSNSLARAIPEPAFGLAGLAVALSMFVRRRSQ
jgi:lysophospholipase L1-like esterase